MKSSRSASARNTRRIRRFGSDTSDNSDNLDSSNMDSARAEKCTRRRHQKPLSSTLLGESVRNVANRTLFNVSNSSDSESSLNVSYGGKMNDDKSTSSSINNSTLFEPQKSNFNNYRNTTQSSCSSSNSDQLKNNSVPVTETDTSSVLHEIIDESIQSSTENIDESLLIIPKKNKNRLIILDSSDESDVDQIPLNNFVSKEKLQMSSFEISSDDDIINSSIKPIQAKHTSQIEMKLNDLSLIEPSDTDNDTSDNYKSFDQSIEPLVENDGFKSPKLTSIETIDLTEDELDNRASEESTHNLKKLTTDEIKSLNMEKTRLEEILSNITTNIETLKKSVKSINLELLPDRGLKLKNAILKEENSLKESKMQLNNVLRKLKEFSEDPIQTSSTSSNFPKPFSINTLTKKAAANIDIGAMGSKALSTYRAQQAMHLDALHRLHKSLDTCPPTNSLADDPRGLKVNLMPHQKYAIAWLLWRERQKPHGGILADDMGLGKTLTMIALILSSEAELEKNLDSEDSIQNIDSNDFSARNTIKGGTIIICPSSLISQWENEIKCKLHPRLLDVAQHYGPNRETSARRLARKNIVITSYNVVMWDHKLHPNTSPLYQIKWKRIIIDEAHIIRNYKSQTSTAVCELSATYRWALTGTPVHNKEADFYALLKFIKCSPFDDWAIWKRWVGNNDDAGRNRLALLTKTLMLRRTKDELSKSTQFQLPTKNFHIINVEFAKEEKEVYEKVLLFSSTLFASYIHEKAEKENAFENGFPVKNKTKLLNKQNLNQDIFQDHPELNKLFKQLNNKQDIQAHHILVLILRLRQLCCHPCLMKNLLENESLNIDGIENTDDLEIVDTMSRMSIGVPTIKNQPLAMVNPIFDESWVSSKIKSVCNMVKEKVLNTDDKAVIVSQWPSMLLLIDKQLNKYHVKTALFSGAISVVKRNELLNEFNNTKGGPKILLLSLTVGGVGLNLVVANHLFLVDIHWNPQLEAQACDRVYRVGQTKPVNIYKFICTSSIETAIQNIQSHKLEVANNVLGGYKNFEGTKLTFDDLKAIFKM